MVTPFTVPITVRFAHVDGAGIVFYPRYLEMVNEAVERWFEAGLCMDFRELHFVRGHGVPMRRIAVEFLKPSRLADKLALTLRVVKIGRSSFNVVVACSCAGELRFTADATLVYMNLASLAAAEIPEDLRERMGTFVDP